MSSKNIFTYTLSVLCLFLLVIFFTNCGLPNPFSQNTPESPIISGYSDGTKIFFFIDGKYTSETFSDFSGVNIYLGDNNDEANIKKRLVYISNKNKTPSYSINLYKENFPLTLEMEKDFAFRLTKEAKDTDFLDEGVLNTEDLIENKENWTIKAGKTFYFFAKALSKNKESEKSEVLEIEIPNVYSESIKYDNPYPLYINKTNEEKIKITFYPKNKEQKVQFEYSSEEKKSATDTPYMESLSLITNKNWQKVNLPKNGFSKKNQVYEENYIIFSQIIEKSKISYYIKIFVKEITNDHVKVIIYKFIKK